MARILVVEDDPVTCKFMRLTLETEGYQVDTAYDGGDAATRLTRAQPPYDVVVTDNRLPTMSGLELVALARRVDPNLPCIMATGTAELDVAIAAMEAGAVNYIVKPFRGDTLRIVVMRALERRTVSEDALRLRLVVPLLEQFTMTLADMVEARDVETQAHCRRLVAMSDRIADRLELSLDERHAVRLGACLHDVGKIAIPDAVLRKAGPLLPEEWEVVRGHPEVGARLLEGVEQWRSAQVVVRHHHERFDGNGYPAGLRGRDIPLGARIVAVADAVDVMVTGRSYSPARSLDATIDELLAHRGTQFDPDVVDAFVGMAGIDALMGRALVGVGTVSLLGETVR
ncbi:MAG TPA: HD domain-containing phosphohydrolase [Candidatus Angelobacter sp.]|jgi:putative two-component system response regulator|nr:HD domain-containing phosphohydrolase [Candidatus Angelobacter sp.]